ncbi:MAG TPA: hypothetical protein PKE06_10795 [Flavilitoribacter sp.]|nr:hypothetical protein [Flavilitoribacter sp.]HMQ89122.1 hypothetical protein [Flavilitoribacter sp.]
MKNRLFIFILALTLFSGCTEDLQNVQVEINNPDEKLDFRGPNQWLGFYKGATNNRVYFARSSNGTNWTEFGDLANGALTDRTPSGVLFGSKVFVFYRGNSTGRLWMSSQNASTIGSGGTWVQTPDVGGVTTLGSGPSAVVFNGEIFVFTTGGGQFRYFRSTNGVNFTGPFTVVNVDGAPIASVSVLEVAPVVHNGRLFIFSLETFGNWIRAYSTTTGNLSDWHSDAGTFVGDRSSTGMSAVSTGSEIILTFSGLTSRRLYEKRATSSNGTGGLNWNSSASQIGAWTTDRPGIAISNTGKLVVLFKDGSGTGNNYVRGFQAPTPSTAWSPIPWASSGSGYFGRTSHGVSTVFTGF